MEVEAWADPETKKTLFTVAMLASYHIIYLKHNFNAKKLYLFDIIWKYAYFLKILIKTAKITQQTLNILLLNGLTRMR